MKPRKYIAEFVGARLYADSSKSFGSRPRMSPSKAARKAIVPIGRLASLAATTQPPSCVEVHRGDELDSELRRQCLDLARRNLRGLAIWDGAEKREELCHEDTSLIAIRQQGSGLLGYASYRITKEEGVDVAYLYELHIEERARGLRCAPHGPSAPAVEPTAHEHVTCTRPPSPLASLARSTCAREYLEGSDWAARSWTRWSNEDARAVPTGLC